MIPMMTEEEVLKRLKELNNLRLVAGAALQLMECLGGDEGYFPTAGATKTDTLRRALRQAGFKIEYRL
jgi:hypothetical protein